MSQREHRRRLQVLANDSYTAAGKWRMRAACDRSNGIAEAAGAVIPFGFCAESLNLQREAALFCHQVCPVREDCYLFATELGLEFYVWGGTTETERRHLMEKARKEREEKKRWQSAL